MSEESKAVEVDTSSYKKTRFWSNASTWISLAALAVSVISALSTSLNDRAVMKANARTELRSISSRLHQIPRETALLQLDPPLTASKNLQIQSLGGESRSLVVQAADLILILDDEVTESEVSAVAGTLLSHAEFDRCRLLIDIYQGLQLSASGQMDVDCLYADLDMALGRAEKARAIYGQVLASAEHDSELQTNPNHHRQILIGINLRWAKSEAAMGHLDTSRLRLAEAETIFSQIEDLGYRFVSAQNISAARSYIESLTIAPAAS